MPDLTATAHSAAPAALLLSPAHQTVAAALCEVDRMTRRGARLTTFLLADDPRLKESVTTLTRRNGGRTLRPDPERLGAFVLDDLVSRRSRR